jgi:hypothetical protein
MLKPAWKVFVGWHRRLPATAVVNQAELVNLKRITLLTAIAQLLGLLCNAFNFLNFLDRGRGGGHDFALITWPVSLLAQAMLVFFLFYLFSKQKAG